VPRPLARLSALSLSPASLRAASSGASIVARRRPVVGATVSAYRLQAIPRFVRRNGATRTRSFNVVR
jgi:hypothetical protein